MAELEDAIAERRERLVVLARESATQTPTLADVAPLLDRLPILASRLDTVPRGELRALFDLLHLEVVHRPAEGAIDVALTIYDRGDDADDPTHMCAEDWSAPPASQNANLALPVEGPAISLEDRHAKVRREGYLK